MKVSFLSPALQELEDAFEWYQDQVQGLGYAFLREIDEAVHRVVSWPMAQSKIGKYLRRCLVRRFPFGLIYEVDGNKIVILAVAHLHRKPFYWTHRK